MPSDSRCFGTEVFPALARSIMRIRIGGDRRRKRLASQGSRPYRSVSMWLFLSPLVVNFPQALSTRQLPGQRHSAGRQDSRSTSSSSTSELDVPSTRLSTVGNRAFPVAAARTCNTLPAEVTSSNSLQTFKTKLKSHLFSASFPQFPDFCSVL